MYLWSRYKRDMKRFLPSSKKTNYLYSVSPSAATSRPSDNPGIIFSVSLLGITATGERYFQCNVYICAQPLLAKLLLTWFLCDLKQFKSNNLSSLLLFFLWLIPRTTLPQGCLRKRQEFLDFWFCHSSSSPVPSLGKISPTDRQTHAQNTDVRW